MGSVARCSTQMKSPAISAEIRIAPTTMGDDQVYSRPPQLSASRSGATASIRVTAPAMSIRTRPR